MHWRAIKEESLRPEVFFWFIELFLESLDTEREIEIKNKHPKLLNRSYENTYGKIRFMSCDTLKVISKGFNL